MYGLRLIIIGLLVCGLALPASANWDSTVASKDGMSFTVEDVNLFWVRNLGADALGQFVRSMILYQEGLKQKLGPSPTDIQDYIDKTMGPDMYKDFVSLFSESAVKRMIEYTITIDNYEEWLRQKIQRENNINVTEKEAYAYFLKNNDRFQVPDGVQLSLIQVESKTQADEVIKRLKAGEDFNAVAAEVNVDPQLKARRGELGVYRQGDKWLPPELEDAAFKLEAGHYTDPLKGDYYNILFCHKKVPGFSPSFDEIKDDVMMELLDLDLQPYLETALQELMDREWSRFKIDAHLFQPEPEGAPAAPPKKP